nr:zinc finger protein 98-like [Vanessa tameamea]
MLKALCIIVETDSSILLKDDDGQEIKLKLLKNPINIESLICEYEDDTEAQNEPFEKNNIQTDKNINIFEKKEIRMKKLPTVSMLKEPLLLNDIPDQKCGIKSVVCDVKTVKNWNYGNLKKRNSFDYHKWKQNAITLIEFSYVYPFIHASNKYKCFVCAKAFLEAVLLREHSTGFHTIKDFRRELNNRVRDKNLKMDVTIMQCKLCQLVSPNIYSLKVHLKGHGIKIDPDFQDNIIPFKLEEDNFQCQICNETYLKLRLLIIHMSKHFNNYSCEICGSVFISLHLLKRHLQTHKIGNYPCEICDKVFSNSAKRTMHMRGVHLKQYPRTCPICPERFNSNYQRTKHLRIVHNQSSELFKCETCGREYDLKYQLLVHIRSVHMQERNHECGICHSRFFSKYCLSRHMVIHTGDKNFKCEICGKAYARSKNLKEHIKSHDVGEVSAISGEDYNDRTALATHLNNSNEVLN